MRSQKEATSYCDEVTNVLQKEATSYCNEATLELVVGLLKPHNSTSLLNSQSP